MSRRLPPLVHRITSPLESEKDPLQSREDGTEQLTPELPQPLEEKASVLDERETPSSDPLDESRLEAKEEPIQKGSELTESLTDAEMAERLGVKTSTPYGVTTPSRHA
jgi:hypothetical protein